MFLTNRDRSYRLIALGLVAIIGLSLILIFANQASSQSGDVPPIYDDVSLDNAHYDNIARLKAAGILDRTDCASGKFCPNEPLSRRTIAVWMVRVLDGDQAPDFVDPNAVETSRFADIEASEPESLFIERLSDLRVTAGCATKPWRYCPDMSVSRGQMASFLARAFGLGGADDAGFIDVSEDNAHYDTINMLAASGITAGCSSTPKRYCPNLPTTRAQMTSFLSRAIDWRQAREGNTPDADDPDQPTTSPTIPITITGSDNSLQPQVTYDEAKYQANVSWRTTTNNPNQVTNYIVQWRPAWSGFSDELQQVVDVSDQQAGRYQISIPERQNLYAVRIVTAKSDGEQLATNEIKIPSNSNQLRDLIKERIIDPHKDEWPWLQDTWQYINGPEFGFAVRNKAGFAKVTRGGSLTSAGQLYRPRRVGLTVGPHVLKYFDSYTGTIAHELGHVYTLTGGVPKDPEPVGIGFLYFSLLYVNYGGDARDPTQCAGHELYADMANFLFHDQTFDPGWGTIRGGGGYWASCGFRLNSQTYESVKRDAPDVARGAFKGQIPDWFYNTYEKADGSINLERLWADINTLNNESRKAITYHLKDEFGGYCSEEQVRKFFDGEISSLSNPWRGGGC